VADIATPTRPVHVGPPALRASLATNLKWSVGLTAAAIAYFVFYYLDTYFRGSIPDFLHDFMTTWLPIQPINVSIVYVMLALGLNVVVGYAGLLDLGFVAFWAIGGYVAGWLMSSFFYQTNFRFFGSQFSADRHLGGLHINFWFVLIAAALMCGLMGIVIGAPTLRLRSDYLALVTLGFGEIIPEVFYNGDNVFGQNITNGTQGITPTDSIRFFTFDETGAIRWGDLGVFDQLSRFLLFCLLAALIMFASLRIRDGKLGRAWLAIREDELAASAMGVPLMRTKLSAYAVGAIAGGIGGAAFVVQVNGVLPDRFRFDISITLLAMVVLGGMGNVWGVTIGALLLSWLNLVGLQQAEKGYESITGKSISFQFLVFGLILVLMMLFRREGLIPEARTRLVLREPGRTEAESLGADMEDQAPELEVLPYDGIHPDGVPPAAKGDVDGRTS
jgi:branched-chain amino acid transport system permease protein